MIHVVMSCQLGNWLFQYAAGKSLSLMHGVDLELDLYTFGFRAKKERLELGQFKAEFRFHNPLVSKARRFLVGGNYPDKSQVVFKEKNWGFDPDFLSLPNSAYLTGLFQSDKYFQSFETEIRADLQFKISPTDLETVNVEHEIRGCNAISIHVRRGDYLTSLVHNVCGVQYYLNAIAYIRLRVDKPHFFFFSDDIQWCIKSLQIENATYVDVVRSRHCSVNDMRLMSLCEHHIISNSTYSWWGAWLNDSENKIVVTPDIWFNNDDNQRAMQDTVPQNWVKVRVEGASEDACLV